MFHLPIRKLILCLQRKRGKEKENECVRSTQIYQKYLNIIIVSLTYFSQSLWKTPQYLLWTANHSQSPGPILMLTEQKLLFSWCPGVRAPGTFMYSCTEFIPRMVWPMWERKLPSGQSTCGLINKSGDDVSVWEICAALSPGQFWAFQCCTMKSTQFIASQCCMVIKQAGRTRD